MNNKILAILTRHYARMWGDELCVRMTEHLTTGIDAGTIKTWQDVKMYVWMQTNGGGVAEAVATAVMEAYSDIIVDSTYESRYL